MNWSKMLKPTRWKVLFSLMPFTFPLVQIIFANNWYYKYLSVKAIIFQSDIFLILGGIESIISQPFAPILRPLGWWSRESIFVGPDGPLLPGSISVAITYSLLIYLTWSLISTKMNKNRQPHT